jgi:hypothetical protein
MSLGVRMHATRAASGLRIIGPNLNPAPAANMPALVALGALPHPLLHPDGTGCGTRGSLQAMRPGVARRGPAARHERCAAGPRGS